MMTSTMQDKPLQKDTQKHTSKIWIQVAAILFWIGVWQLLSMALGQEILLASPVSVLRKLGELVVTLDFWQSIAFSFFRIVGGFCLALLLGILLAVLSCLSAGVEILLKPLMTAIKATPVASFIILCLIWIPSRNLSVFIAFLMVLPVVYTNILEGIRQTDEMLLEMAAVFSVSKGKQILYIYLSQIFPYLLSACTLGLGLCWKAGVAAEVIGIPKGSMGEKLYNAKIYLNTPDLFAWTVVIVLISFFFEKCFLRLLKLTVGRIERI